MLHFYGPVIIAEKACLVTGDLIVVVVTWWKTYITVQDVRKHKTSAPLAVFLFRDGQSQDLVIGSLVRLIREFYREPLFFVRWKPVLLMIEEYHDLIDVDCLRSILFLNVFAFAAWATGVSSAHFLVVENGWLTKL